MKKLEVFQYILEQIEKIQKDKPIRIAINGIEGTGKTTFAKGLAEYLNQKNINAIHVSIDGFHNNKEIRYRQGRDSARGYYEDSYDEHIFVEKVLIASQSDTPNYTEATHDLASDQYLDLPPIEISHNTILITDGCHLLKPVYRKHWDYKIYLKTDFNTAEKRGVKRETENLGGQEIAQQKFRDRYHAASQIYREENQPESWADLIVDNTNFEDLKIVEKIPE